MSITTTRSPVLERASQEFGALSSTHATRAAVAQAIAVLRDALVAA